MKVLATVLSGLLLTGRITAAATSIENPTVTQVDICSSWGGLGEPRHAQLSIRLSNDEYFLGDQAIGSTAIDHLLRALQQPPVPQPELDNLGVTQAWLESNAKSGPPANAGSFTAAAPNLQALYRNAFSDLSTMTQVVPSLFKYVQFDDYPSIKVIVTSQDGSTICATTHSYYLFMLPWQVTVGERVTATFNADISRAVAALMPEKTTNRERLAGYGVLSQVQDALMRHIERVWNLLDAENKAGPAMGRLRERYDVVTAEINPYHNVEYGVMWRRHRDHEENLHATLRKPGFPANFVDALVLRYHQGETEGVEGFLRAAGKFEDLTLSVGWLKDLMEQGPHVQYRLAYVHDASLGDKAMDVFSADMRKIGKQDLAAEVRRARADVALLIIGMQYYESYWLVLPDKRLLLWRYRGQTGLLRWTSSDFTGMECSKYQDLTDRCVGSLVSADGVLLADGASTN